MRDPRPGRERLDHGVRARPGQRGGTRLSSSAGPPSGSGRNPPPPRSGERCGPLLLQEELGAGAYGRVYRARHLELGRVSAVKIVPGALGDERRRRRFEREVEALGRLSHPGIVRLHAAFAIPGGLACEMELIEGQSLEDRLQHGGPLPWREAAGLVAELARAVAHAHAAGVLHRDLKPANVLLRADGHPVLADLGLSRLVGETSSLTAAGAMIGTPLFMPLEALKGQADAPTVDVYGLGAVLHAALTGEPPVSAGSLPALALALERGPAPLGRRDMPPALDGVRLRALASDPAARHASAELLAADLEAVLAGRATSSTLAGARLLRAAGRRWPLALAGLLLAAALALPLLVLRRGGGVAPPAPEDPLARAVHELAAGRDPQGQALRRLLAACQDPAARARLEVALAEVGSAAGPALQLVRATARTAGGGPVEAPDLLALTALAPGGEGEALLARAARQEPAPAGLLEAARAVHAAHPDWAPAALLLAEACLRTGELPAREEAARALGAAGGGPRAARIRAALAAADALVAELRRGGDVLEKAAHADEPLRALSAPELLPGVLAPVEPAMWQAMRTGGLLVTGAVKQTANLLRSLQEQLSPSLVVLVDMASTDAMEGTAHPPAELLARVVPALREEKPLLAGWALARGVELEIDAHRTGLPRERLLQLADQAEDAVALLGRLEGEAARSEEAFSLLARRRASAAAVLALLDLARSSAPTERPAIWERALRSARQALETSEVVRIKKWLEHDSVFYVDLLAALGRLDECEPMLPLHPRPAAIQAELARRRGRPEEALELAERGIREEEQPPWANLHAARALALLDLGRREEAQAALEAARVAEKQGGPGLTGLRVEDLRARLQAEPPPR